GSAAVPAAAKAGGTPALPGTPGDRLVLDCTGAVAPAISFRPSPRLPARSAAVTLTTIGPGVPAGKRTPLREVGGSVTSSQPSVADAGRKNTRVARSEEHTSELQSRFDLVCRLLLEKKN